MFFKNHRNISSKVMNITFMQSLITHMESFSIDDERLGRGLRKKSPKMRAHAKGIFDPEMSASADKWRNAAHASSDNQA